MLTFPALAMGEYENFVAFEKPSAAEAVLLGPLALGVNVCSLEIICLHYKLFNLQCFSFYALYTNTILIRYNDIAESYMASSKICDVVPKNMYCNDVVCFLRF